MKKNIGLKSGFTLLEILLVVTILGILAVVSRDFYGSFVSGAQLNTSASTIIYDLRNTRDKAMNGLDDRNWGVHFVNGASDYYEIFSTPDNYANPAKVISVSAYLSSGITFLWPVEGNSADVIFSKISGTTTASSLIIKSNADSKSIFIQAQGLVN